MSSSSEETKNSYQQSDQQVTVKFHTSDTCVLTKNYKNNYKISQIKNSFVEMFNIPYNEIILQYNEETINDTQILSDFETDPFGILDIKLQTINRKYKINVENVYKDLAVPDILTVHVQTENEGIKEVVVEIENRAIDKPNLGGYRHLITGIQYEHGYTQTGPPKPKLPPEMKNHRKTQTYFTRNRTTDVEIDKATQMTNTNTWIPTTGDRILTPQRYETAEERNQRLDIDGKVRTIQRYYRAWKTRKILKEMHAEFVKRMKLQQQHDERERGEDEERRRKDLISKVYPLTNGDFSMLYAMVDRWKKSEIDHIAKYYCGAAKILAFSILLDREIQLLQSIDRIRQQVRKEMEIKKVVDFFKAIGTPLEWYSEYKNVHIEMDTLETQKGREFFTIFQSISDRNQTKDEKIQNYINLKAILNTHNCTMKKDVVQLIDRIVEMLARGIEEKHLTMLQKRIETMLLQHFKQDECNDGVTEHMKKIMNKQMEKSLIECKRCGKLKTLNAYGLNARQTNNRMVCNSCKWVDKVQEPWMDLSPYHFILQQIRKYERTHRASSSVVFILQDRDIHHLVNDIWHGHSAISECNDIYQLRMCRWRKNEEWSPWNCILLTVEEMKVHLKIHRLEDVYEMEFFNHVFNKHALARNHFSQLEELDKYFTNNTKNDELVDENFWMKKPSEHCLKLE